MTLPPWPKAPVIYQIYPRSFLDTTGSGMGDLNGVIKRLDHVASLGVDAIWLSPFYPSPLVDGGYDISDHRDVHPLFGTLDHFDTLVTRAHDLGLRVIIDQVFNHTSTQSPWFQRSVAGDPKYDEYYVWADPKPDGSVPNNWLSIFGPPAWTWNHIRRQYYFHNFLSAQPSLNLRNEAVQDELASIANFWRDRGVDGFRIDAVTSFLFDTSMKDNPPASREVQKQVFGETFMPYTYQDHSYDILPGDGLEFVAKLRDWAGDDAFLIGEVSSGNQSVELSCGLHTTGRLDAGYCVDLPEGNATAATYADILSRAEDPAMLGWWLSSHDQPRHGNKAGDGTPHDLRFLAFLLATAPGPVLIYQGEELGLPQPNLHRSHVTDPFDLHFWPDGVGREGSRVPIPWTEGPNHGFTTGTSWLPMDWADGLSVAVQDIADDSVLNFYRKALKFRGAKLTDLTLQDWAHDGEVISLTYPSAKVMLNFGKEEVAARANPAIASGPMDGAQLPGRTGALWLT